MDLVLVPLIGPFHLRSPAYNAVSVRDLLAAWEPEMVVSTALAEGSLTDPRWQDTTEIALPLAVVPWARRADVKFEAIGRASREVDASAEFRRYLEPFPEPRRRLAEIDAHLEPVAELLQRPLALRTILDDLVPALRRHQEAREAEFGDGPATDWLRERSEGACRRLLDLGPARVALLAPVEHLPPLQDALGDAGVTPQPPPAAPVTPESRERALLDYAFRGEAPDAGSLLEQLRGVAGAEARYHEANVLLATGHGAEALELLERTSHGDFRSPYFLPGYLLGRLGQLRDLAGRRDDAVRAYRGVLALDYAPPEAREAASRGMESPFSP